MPSLLHLVQRGLVRHLIAKNVYERLNNYLVKCLIQISSLMNVVYAHNGYIGHVCSIHKVDMSKRVYEFLTNCIIAASTCASYRNIQHYSTISKQKLDQAILTFFQHFQKSYVGDQAMHSSKQLYSRLSDHLGLPDHLMVLTILVGKIATNLTCYTESEYIIEHMLALFQELDSGSLLSRTATPPLPHIVPSTTPALSTQSTQAATPQCSLFSINTHKHLLLMVVSIFLLFSLSPTILLWSNRFFQSKNKKRDLSTDHRAIIYSHPTAPLM